MAAVRFRPNEGLTRVQVRARHRRSVIAAGVCISVHLPTFCNAVALSRVRPCTSCAPDKWSGYLGCRRRLSPTMQSSKGGLPSLVSGGCPNPRSRRLQGCPAVVMPAKPAASAAAQRYAPLAIRPDSLIAAARPPRVVSWVSTPFTTTRQAVGVRFLGAEAVAWNASPSYCPSGGLQTGTHHLPTHGTACPSSLVPLQSRT